MEKQDQAQGESTASAAAPPSEEGPGRTE
jgi:hypothetical protein